MVNENAKKLLTADEEIEALLREAISGLLNYCIRHDWSGHDPYDGLNSRIFNALPLRKSSFARLAFIQAIKRLPINLRPVLLIPKGANPKGLAVFSSALITLSRSGLINEDALIRKLLARMAGLRSAGPNCCWGYNFDWQTRTSLVPKFSPNIICTTFAGNALLDACTRFGHTEYLEMAISAGNFILNDLQVTRNGDELCFSYTPFYRDQVHNANLLGATYLARLYAITGKREFLDPAERAVLFSVRRQSAEGAWAYGESRTQGWTDNFHTGYNLLALRRFMEYTGSNEYRSSLDKGFRYYKKNFFTESGLPKYYHDRLYPIDIHSVSQSLITLMEFRDLDRSNPDLALRILGWALREMKSSEGYFYYQKKRLYKNRIPYARWSQAWMLLALSAMAESCHMAGSDIKQERRQQSGDLLEICPHNAGPQRGKVHRGDNKIGHVPDSPSAEMGDRERRLH